jgi:dolichol-phosphate mannosyltransferase
VGRIWTEFPATRKEFAPDFPSNPTGDSVELTLSVILPVHNAELSLVGNVHELLEVLPDISARFEILIVDDGSTDQTADVAYELARCYPQVNVVRHAMRQGSSAAIQTGMVRTTGDVVFVHDDDTPISATELRSLWSLRNEQDLVSARAEKPLAPAGQTAATPRLTREMHSSHNALAGLGGIQMFRRQGIEQLSVAELATAEFFSQRAPRSPRRRESIVAGILH